MYFAAHNVPSQAPVLFHRRKKVTKEEWAAAVNQGHFSEALKSVNPAKPHGPWKVMCDNEGFLDTMTCKAAHKKAKVSLWHVPPRSPDLNPVEQYWSWLRRRLRQLDLKDVVAKRPGRTKQQYVQRVKQVMKSAKSKLVSKNIMMSYRKTCQRIHDLGGAAAMRG